MSYTPPVVSDGFAYANDSFLAESSNKSFHRRATLSELRTLFKPPTKSKSEPAAKDHVGHWYEAQLLHYGLPPSKTKSVAKMRLLDAVNKGDLAVPSHIEKLEANLKKEWLKRDRAAKKQDPPQGATKARGTSASQANKRTKTASQAPQKRARKGATNVPAPDPPAPTQPTFSRKQTARKSARNATPDWTSSSSSSQPPPSPPRSFARKSASNVTYENSPSPEPKRKRGKSNSGGGAASKRARAAEDSARASPGRPLGLLNGVYSIRSQDLNQWPGMYDEKDFSLILCLEGDSMWGAYDFGIFSGIMYFHERPWQASEERIPFTWRGREHGEGEIDCDPENEGWMQFHGNGIVEGMISCYGAAMFYGTRTSGRETRAPRDAWSMRDEWDELDADDYEDDYEDESQAIWGGGGGWCIR